MHPVIIPDSKPTRLHLFLTPSSKDGPSDISRPRLSAADAADFKCTAEPAAFSSIQV